MYLVMVIEGVEVARKKFLPSDKLSSLISEMKKQFNVKNSEEKEPQFYLVNVPSVINNFKSLGGEVQ